MMAWESFPRRLSEEIEKYLAGFTKIRRGASGKRIRPCKQSTIDTRLRELQAFVRMAVIWDIPSKASPRLKPARSEPGRGILSRLLGGQQ